MRILFCTIGATPQVVTETVWALMHQRTPSWTPDEIHIVTTTHKLNIVREALQSPHGQLAGLLGRLPPVTVHIPCRGGAPITLGPLRKPSDWGRQDKSASMAAKGSARPDGLSDVNSQEDAALMGNLIVRLMAGFAHNPDTEIHVSLAGGRKTMSAHALLALSLLGRGSDEASHVLVSPVEFEDHIEFWYPDQGSFIHTKEELRMVPLPAPSLDPKGAHIVLVPTPAPLMRYEIKDRTALERLDLAEIVQLVNVAAVLRSNPNVLIDTKRNAVLAGGVDRTFSPKLFAIYRLIAAAYKENWAGVGPSGDEVEDKGGSHSGWLSVPHICTGKTRLGKKIDEVLLQYMREAVVVEGSDPDDHRSINEWINVASASAPALKLALAEKAIGANRRLIDAFKKEFGSPAAAIIAPEVVYFRQTRPIRGGKIWIGGATRFGIRTEIPRRCINIE